MPREISIRCKIQIKDLMGECLSFGDIAERLGISRRSVIRVAAQWNIYRTPEEITLLRSKGRINLIRKERRRITFGLDQKSRLKVVHNPERKKLRFLLKRKGYIVTPGDNKVYYPNEKVRKYEYEIKGKSLGLKFYPLEAALQ